MIYNSYFFKVAVLESDPIDFTLPFALLPYNVKAFSYAVPLGPGD